MVEGRRIRFGCAPRFLYALKDAILSGASVDSSRSALISLNLRVDAELECFNLWRGVN